MDVASWVAVGTVLTFIGTIYAIVTGRKSARENADIAALAVTREDWVASQEQSRADRAELRATNAELRRNNENLAVLNRQLATDNLQLRTDMDEVKTEMADQRRGLAVALTHVENCEAELAALRGGA